MSEVYPFHCRGVGLDVSLCSLLAWMANPIFHPWADIRNKHGGSIFSWKLFEEMILPFSFHRSRQTFSEVNGHVQTFCVGKVCFTVLQASQSIGQCPHAYGAWWQIGRQTHKGVASAMCWVLCTLRAQAWHLFPSLRSLVKVQGHNLDTQSMCL